MVGQNVILPDNALLNLAVVSVLGFFPIYFADIPGRQLSSNICFHYNFLPIKLFVANQL
jgi:hypothetical protein